MAVRCGFVVRHADDPDAGEELAKAQAEFIGSKYAPRWLSLSGFAQRCDMSATLIEPAISDDERRRRLYAGDLMFYTPRASTQAFIQHAWQLICEAFDPIDPEKAQFEMPVEKFVELIAPLKTRFHTIRSRRSCSAILEDFGCDVDATYFDVPKLRIVSTVAT